MASLHPPQFDLEDCKRKRTRAANELRSLAADIQNDHENVNIAKLAGTSASLLGTGLVIGGAIASFFTFGAATPLTVAGGGMIVSGALTAGGAELAKSLLTDERRKKAQKAMDDDCEAITHMLNMMASCLDDKMSLERAHLTTQLGKAGKSVYEIVKVCKTAGKVVQISSVGAEVAGTTIKSLFKALGTAGRLSLGLTLVTVPLDVFTLVKTSIDVHKGSIPKLASSLRGIADAMESDFQMMEQAFREKQQTLTSE